MLATTINTIIGPDNSAYPDQPFYPQVNFGRKWKWNLRLAIHKSETKTATVPV